MHIHILHALKSVIQPIMQPTTQT